MLIELSTLVKQAARQVSCNLDEEAAILNLESSLYFGVDEVGTYIWQALSKPKAVSELCRAVLDRFEVEEHQCQVDVLEFLAKLENAGLIEIVVPES